MTGVRPARPTRWAALALAVGSVLLFTSGAAAASTASYTLSVSLAGAGSGTVTSSPAGISCGSSCSFDYASGTQVTLSAIAASASSFSGWSGACTGAGRCTVTMSSARSVTASFGKAPPVPKVTGRILKSAEHEIKAAGFRVGSVKRRFSKTVPEGRVISQTPKADAQLRTGGKVGLAVSKGLTAKEAYTDPLRAVRGLFPERIDMGVDYAGYGPLRAVGDAVVTFASNHDAGPLPCWGRTCWPGGGAVIYRLTDGPFVGKYVYAAENISVVVHRGQAVKAGQRVAVLHPGSPHLETGWASGKGPETLAIARHQQCSCGDPGGWSTVEGRDFDRLLVFVGAPSGYLQYVPLQTMPRRWPAIP